MSAFVEVATISRDASTNNSRFNHIYVDVNRLVMLVGRDVAGGELWISSDRGATWNFYAVPNSGIPGTFMGPELFGSDLFFTLADGDKLYYTPAANPGAGGFTEESNILFDRWPHASQGFVTMPGGGTDTRAFRRTAPGVALSIGVRTATPAFTETLSSVGLSDGQIIEAQDSTNANADRFTRYTGTNPVTVSIDATSPVDFYTPPGVVEKRTPWFWPVSTSEYWFSVQPASSVAQIYRTIDSGASWANVPIDSAFFSETPASPASGTAYAFIAFENQRLMIVRHSTNDAIKAAYYDTGSGSIKPYSDRLVSGYETFKFATSINSDGNLDMYMIAVEGATKVHVYRLTVLGKQPPVGTPKRIDIASPRTGDNRMYRPIIRVY